MTYSHTFSRVSFVLLLNLLDKNLNIKSENLAIIPTEYKTEILCYEFKGTVEDKTFLIYINAQNGNEENIYILIEDENGMLTI